MELSTGDWWGLTRDSGSPQTSTMTVHDVLVEPIADAGHALLTVDEFAVLMRVSREDVELGIAEGDVDVVIRDGVLLIDVDSFWRPMDPFATEAPQHLIEQARLTSARSASTVDECQAARRLGPRKPTSSHESSSRASVTDGPTLAG